MSTMKRIVLIGLMAIAWGRVTTTRAEGPESGGHEARYRPDPASVQRVGPGYRYPQAGWIVLHIEGEPYERGYQHGRLMAPEIAAYVRCCATQHSPKAPEEN